ncbi:MAG: MopE-related protein, partial [Candidatus Bathyarchaeota archaeon]
MRKLVIVFLLLLGFFTVSLFFNTDNSTSGGEFDSSLVFNQDSLDVYFFYGKGCPHCAAVEPFLNEMEQKYPIQIHRYDVYTNRSLLPLFDSYSSNYEIPLTDRGIPTLFVSETYFVGDQPIIEGFEEQVIKVFSNGSSSTLVLDLENQENINNEIIGVPIDLSIVTLTLAAFVDAISPCSIAILVFLIGARVLVADRKKRALKVGLAFCLSIYIAYFLFGLGLFTVVQFSGFTNIFGFLVSLIAFSVGILYLRDVFSKNQDRFKMEVPNKLKPLLMKMLKGVTSPVGAFLMGFVVCLFELPCTGGPYLFILGQLADSATRISAIPLLLYYNFIFVLPLLVISVLLYSNRFSIGKVRGWNDEHKGLLRLIGGVTMIFLGFVVMPIHLIARPLLILLSVLNTVCPPLLVMIGLFLAVRFVKDHNLSHKVIRYNVPVIMSMLLTIPMFTVTIRTLPMVSGYTENLELTCEVPDQLEPFVEADGVEKTDGPEVHAFIMSYCPYGLQFLKAYVPVMELLGEEVNLEVNFVPYVMHGEKEVEENTRMHCIQKEAREKFADYLRCFVENDDPEKCIAYAQIDKHLITSCIWETDEKFELSKTFQESEDRFPKYGIDAELAQQYGVRGSPTFVINGEVISVERSAEAIKQTVCSALDTSPKSCETELNTSTERPGIGPIGDGNKSDDSEEAPSKGCVGVTNNALKQPQNHNFLQNDALKDSIDASVHHALDSIGVETMGMVKTDTKAATQAVSGVRATEEICDGNDNDSDGTIDEGCDDDNDDYCDSNMTTVGYPAVCPNGGNDCDDTDGNINPGATDTPGNDLDENCNDFVACYDDSDSDGYGATTSGESSFTATNGISDITGACGSNDGDVWDDTNDDCYDADASINPGAIEICNGLDDDCNAATADGSDEPWLNDPC